MKKILASTLLLTCSLLLANETKKAEPTIEKPSVGQIEQLNKDKVIADQLKNSQLTEEDKQKMFQDFLNKKVLNVFAAQHGIPINILSISSTNVDTKNNLTSFIIDVKDNEVKGLIFMTQDGAFLLGDFITSDGKNLFKETFMNINKDFFDKQNMEKNLEKDKIKTERVNFIKDLEAGKYGDMIRTIKGNNSKTETLYLFTDLNCPFCKMYETGIDRNGQPMENFGLKNDLNNYKEIKVIMYPLYMLQGHETAIQRSLWFYNKTKNVKEQAKMLEILNKATNADIKDLVVDKKELEKYEAFVKDKTKGLMSTGAIEGTPSLILEDGTNLLDR